MSSIRFIGATAALALLFFAGNEETWIGAGLGAMIAWALITWLQHRQRLLDRQRHIRDAQIVEAAEILAHAFSLTNKPCIDETRALSRAVFLGGAKMKELVK